MQKLSNKKYRDEFVSSHVGTNVASQVFALRNKKHWSQSKLAKRAGMAQPRISVIEDPDYEDFSINTLKRLASAFDVALVVKFVSFGELVDWVASLSPEKIAVPSFEEEIKKHAEVEQNIQSTPKLKEKSRDPWQGNPFEKESPDFPQIQPYLQEPQSQLARSPSLVSNVISSL